jgi:hypothetical protein
LFEKTEEISGTEKAKEILDSTGKNTSVVGQLHVRHRLARGMEGKLPNVTG